MRSSGPGTVGGSMQVRRVWELVSWAEVPRWLAGLSAGRVAA
jgi:hypothetical protein